MKNRNDVVTVVIDIGSDSIHIDAKVQGLFRPAKGPDPGEMPDVKVLTDVSDAVEAAVLERLQELQEERGEPL